MTAGSRAGLILVPVLFVLLSCATGRGREQSAPGPGPAPSEPAAVEPGTGEPLPPASGPPAGFVATEELYRRTFDEIAAVIAELDGIIREQDYEAWQAHLSREYIATTGSPEFLAQASKSARLSSQKVVLRSLRDYFVNVVVQSRLQAALDEIRFVDEDNVKAMTVVGDESYILYWLMREDGMWKIGIVQDR